jgi:uncharacterized membrane-anchored protein
VTRKVPLWGFAAAFVLQAALVGWMLADRAMLLSASTVIRLDVVPVDPRDLFRGDYVVLAYDISRLDTAGLEGDDTLDIGETVYVTLKRDGDKWVPAAVHREDPGDGIVLKGTVLDRAEGCADPCHTYRMAYGLEEFFVPEGEGRALEELRNDQRIAVDVAVGSGGRAALKRLLVDGTVRYEDSMF